MVKKKLEKAVFFDRDGVLVVPNIKNGKSFAPRKIKDFKIYKSSVEQVNIIKNLGYKIFVVTNQPDVSRGVILKKTLNKMHYNLKKKLKIDKIFTCVHTPEKKCKCRKPSPTMILRAANTYGINLKKSFLVGDRLTDIVSGKKAGCRTVFIDRNYKEKKPINQDVSVSNLKEATKFIKLNTFQ